jgi:hypothetical protein
MHLRKLFPEVCPVEVEKNALVCNAGWAALAFGSWVILASSRVFVSDIPSSTAPISAASLTVWATLAAGLGWLLRVPFVQVDRDVLEAAASRSTAGTAEHREKRNRAYISAGILLCGSIASLNWLGCITLKSEGLLEALPAWLIMLVTEAFVLSQPSNWKLLSLLSRIDVRRESTSETHQVDRTYSNEPSISNSAVEMSQTSSDSGPKPSSPLGDFESEPEADNAANRDEADDAIWSRTEFGKDEEGNAFAAGTITTEILPGESTRELVVGFTPAFASIPSVEVELDNESMSVRQLNVTQTGARLLVRKSGHPSDSPVEFCLEWYAVESSESIPDGPGISLP